MSDTDGIKYLWKNNKVFRYGVYVAGAIAVIIVLNQLVDFGSVVNY